MIQQQTIRNVEFSYIPGYESTYVKIYQSPVMAALNMRVVVNIPTMTQISDGIWRIYFNCYIEDNYWVFPPMFTLHSHVHDESYIDAWSSEDPDGYRNRAAYDMLYSQLNVDELEERYMEYIENQGLAKLAEQEC